MFFSLPRTTNLTQVTLNNKTKTLTLYALYARGMWHKKKKYCPREKHNQSNNKQVEVEKKAMFPLQHAVQYCSYRKK